MRRLGDPVPGIGPVPCRVMLIGERPGKDEDRAGVPFVGLAGQELDRYLAAGDINRDEIYITNLVKTYRDGEKPEEWEIARDADELSAELQAVQPDILIMAGAYAIHNWLPGKNVEDIHGIPIAFCTGGEFALQGQKFAESVLDGEQAQEAQGLDREVQGSTLLGLQGNVSTLPNGVRPPTGNREAVRSGHDGGGNSNAVDGRDSQVRCSVCQLPQIKDMATSAGEEGECRRITLYSMFHPAAGFYDPEGQPRILDDFRRLGQLIRGEITPLEDKYAGKEKYSTGANATEWGQVVSIDTEGSRQSPWCATVTSKEGEARLYPKGKRFAIGGTVALHNSMHDLGVLRSLGYEVDEDNFTDTMVWAYLLQLEPQGLKPLARRHCGMEMDSYDDIMGGVSNERALEYLVGAAGCEWPKADKYAIVEDGKVKIKSPQSIGQRIARIISDVAKEPSTDVRRRWENIDYFLREPVEAELGEMPAGTLDDIPFDRALRYACRDADATFRLFPILERQIKEMGLQGVSEIDHGIIPMMERMQTIGMRINPDHFARLEAKCDKLMAKHKEDIRVLTGADINPDSGDQVAELLFTQLKLPWSKLTKGKKRPSTNDKVLEGLRFAHPVVPMVLDYREVSKVRNSFARTLPRTRDAADRIHCNIRITRTVTGRPSATKPNLLAIPVRSELGREVREGFIAGDGKVIGDWDLDQIEMRYMADESGDPTLCGLFNRGEDVHAATAARVFGISIGNVDKMKHRYPAKRVGFGVITGITAVGLLDQMKLANTGRDWTEGDCQLMLDEWFKMYPRVRAYMHQCRIEAQHSGMVRDRWGRIRYLPGAQSPISRIREEALRQSHSHKIQAGAQGLMKRAQAKIWKDMREWWRMEWDVEPLLQIYDSIMLEVVDDDCIKSCVDAAVVQRLTTTTILSVPVTAKGGYGKNWATKDE